MQKKFNFPPEDDAMDGAPQNIEHGVDYMFSAPGKLEFFYNYICYEWNLPSEKVTARTYLDDIQQVSLFAEKDGAPLFIEPERLETPLFQPVIRYLQRRFRVIKVFGRDGTYRVVYKR
jgi:hypothetical protein